MTTPSSSQPPTLLTLPTELRCQILSYCISFPNLHDAITSTIKRDKEYARTHPYHDIRTTKRNKNPNPTPKIKTSTPTILLVCKHLTAEALDLVYRSTLIIEPEFPKSYTGQEYHILKFIPLDVLQRVRYAELKLRRLNFQVLLDLADKWCDKNELEVLKLRFQRWRDMEKDDEERPRRRTIDGDSLIFEFRLCDVRGDISAAMRLVEEAEAWMDHWRVRVTEDPWALPELRYVSPKFWATFKKEMVAFLLALCLAPGTKAHRGRV